MFLCRTALARFERLGKKLRNRIHGLRALQEQLENGRGAGIQQMRVPGARLEYDTIVVEINDPQAVAQGIVRDRR